MNNILLILIFFLTPTTCYSAITFTNDRWESTLDCATMSGCDGMDMANSSIGCGSSSIDAVFNNPLGGGNGFRQFVGDGQNIGSQRYVVYFGSNLNEVWIRYYIKYEAGFHWSSLGYDKLIYFDNGYVFEWYGANSVLLGNGTTLYVDSPGWDETMSCGDVGDGADPSCDGDGAWHAVEIYIKAGAGDGIYRAWIDGAMVANHTNGTFTAPGSVELFGNQNSPANSGGCSSVYQDDFAVYRVSPPSEDAQGNAMIGPIGWRGVHGGRLSGSLSGGGVMR